MSRMKLFSREVQPQQEAEELRAARAESARLVDTWREVDATAFVRRGRWLVEADTDELYIPFTGTIFPRGSSVPAANGHITLAFYVDEHGDLVFLEKFGKTWSDVVSRKAKQAR